MFVAVWTTLMGVALGASFTWILGYHQLEVLWRRLRTVIMDRHHVCLNEEFLLSQMLAQKIRDAHFSPDVIFGISPGGGMIAEWLARAHLADYEKPKRVRAICVHSERSSAAVRSERPVLIDDIKNLTGGLPENSKVLVVSDICRGGESLRVAQEALETHFSPQNVRMAALFCHRNSRTKPHFVALLTEKTVHFDWKESSMRLKRNRVGDAAQQAGWGDAVNRAPHL